MALNISLFDFKPFNMLVIFIFQQLVESSSASFVRPWDLIGKAAAGVAAAHAAAHAASQRDDDGDEEEDDEGNKISM